MNAADVICARGVFYYVRAARMIVYTLVVLGVMYALDVLGKIGLLRTLSKYSVFFFRCG